ncbi:MAG: thioesterase domain-containing protein [Chloroflexota bacterium]|nr:thioesterase domain-containing protein [Chloroflexota bacterium]
MHTHPWVVRTKSRPQLRLFCLPYAGGGAALFRLWADNLPTEVEVCPIFLPGRERRMREAPFKRLQPLVETLAHELQPFMDVPFAFFGHSMGALISFELIRHLRKNQLPGPVHLFASSFRAPQLPDRNPPLHQLSDADIIAMLTRIGGTPPSVLQHAELMKMLIPIMRADFELCETYVYAPEPPLDCPITAFGGEQDMLVSLPELEAWHIQTQGPFSVKLFQGDHFFLQNQQDALLQALA